MDTINFGEVLSADKETHVIVHNFPDPDAISSAMGIIHLMKVLGKKTGLIYYSGEISHPQNKSMITLLNANLIDFTENPCPKESNAILVDMNNIGEGSNQTEIDHNHFNIIAVIDHHKGKHPKNALVDYRPVGACASIIWEYLKDLKFDFSTDDGNLATALVTGIATDTNFLLNDNTDILDFQAYQDLVKYADKQKLKSIMNYPLPTYLFELRQKAFLEENQMIIESTIVAGIGIIKVSKRDALPIIADELLRMNGISTSIVFAIIEDCIDISVRSNNITLDVGNFLQDVFDHGGGKQGAGRAKIPLGFFTLNGNDEINNDVWQIVKKIVISKVQSNVKGD